MAIGRVLTAAGERKLQAFQVLLAIRGL